MFDMTKCKPGDKLKLRDGYIVTFIKYCKDCGDTPYVLKYPSDKFGYRTSTGHLFIDGSESPNDVVDFYEIHYNETSFGFEYGAASVIRLHSDKNTGSVVIEVKTPKQTIQVYVTKTGKMRLFKNGEEIK